MGKSPDPPDSLGDWIRRAEGEDREAWGSLFAAFYDRAVEAALRVVRRKATAEDLAQDFFAKLPRQLRGFSYRGRPQFEAWLARAIRRDAFDYLRSSRREPPSLGDRPAVPDPELERIAIAAITTLDDEALLVLVLHDVEELSHRWIGELLGCSPEASRKRLQRARKKLRERLGN